MTRTMVGAAIVVMLAAPAVGRVLSAPPARRVQKDPAYQTAPAAKPADARAPAGRAGNGATLYKKVGCYQCHANEGQGGLAGPRIGPSPVPYARFLQYIRNPTGDMPPYTARVLTNQDVADIYAFLEARPRPPAVDTIPQLAP